MEAIVEGGRLRIVLTPGAGTRRAIEGQPVPSLWSDDRSIWTSLFAVIGRPRGVHATAADGYPWAGKIRIPHPLVAPP